MTHVERITPIVKLGLRLWCLKSSLCDTYIRVKRTITVPNNGAAAPPNNYDIQVTFKNFASFTDCISETNNTQIDNAKGFDVVMPMYNSIEYSDNYSKTSGSLWQYYRDEPSLDDNCDVNFLGNGALFKLKQKIPGET